MKFKKLTKFLFLVLFIVILLNIKSIFKYFYSIQYENHIMVYSQRYDVEPHLVAAVIRAESNFKQDAISHKDASGLMQIMPETALWIAKSMKLKNFEVEQSYDPEINIAMGCWYLNYLKNEFDGNIDLVLAAYNGGPGNVQKWLKDSKYSNDGKTLDNIPFEETDKYVKKVKTNYNIYLKLYDEKLQ